jgi:hypothetical protein
MKTFLILLLLTLPNHSLTSKTIVGYWKLVEFSGEKGISESDKITNEGIRKGVYKGYIRFNKDSSFETAFIQTSSPASPSTGKYEVSGDIIKTYVKGKESKFKILKLSQDSLQLKLSDQINLFIRVKK